MPRRPNAIQPHGPRLTVDKAQRRVRQLSRQIAARRASLQNVRLTAKERIEVEVALAEDDADRTMIATWIDQQSTTQ